MTNQQTPEQIDSRPPAGTKRQSKADKKQKNLYLSAHARRLLDALSRSMGISETAVVELLVRQHATQENITLEAE